MLFTHRTHPSGHEEVLGQARRGGEQGVEVAQRAAGDLEQLLEVLVKHEDALRGEQEQVAIADHRAVQEDLSRPVDWDCSFYRSSRCSQAMLT